MSVRKIRAARQLNLVLLIELILICTTVQAQHEDLGRHPPDPASMDTSVDPCADFYAYSCGGWRSKNPIPHGQTVWSVYSQPVEAKENILRRILEAAASSSRRRDPVTQKLGDYYAACMDEGEIDAAGYSPLRASVRRIERMRSKREIASVVATVHDNALFHFRSVPDLYDSTQVIAEVDEGGLGLPDRDLYLKQDANLQALRQTYLAHVQKMLGLLGKPPDATAAAADAAIRIETVLAKASLTRTERRDPQKMYHKMTRKELAVLSPSFDWDSYFAKIEFSSTMPLNVTSPEFLGAMNAELEREDLPSWKAYLRWHLIHASAPHLSPPFLNANFDFYGKTLTGAQQLEPRWKRCVNYADQDLGEALGKAYVEQTFSAEGKQHAQNMVRELKEALKQDIESLPWMTPTTKEHALEKLTLITDKIGYPDQWRDYHSLVVTRSHHWENVQWARAFEFHREIAKIGQPGQRGEWQMTPSTINASYDEQMNDITFPAAILQVFAFDTNPAAASYGRIGGTIGHELIHGFDDKGRRFDGRGNLRDWWSPEDSQQFEQRTRCISHQYSQYVAIDDTKVNGELTMGENVADLGGLILAYMAWHARAKNQDSGPIEGLTPEQQFFVGYAQNWCANRLPQSQWLRATTDTHSPEQFRTNGVVSNMPEFQHAFQCRAGALMVKEDRCRVW